MPASSPWQIVAVALLGLVAGTLGGLAGIGGSLIMLPGLALLLGFSDASQSEQHTYMAAAMCVNVLVSAPAAWRHHRARAVRLDVARWLLPAMAIAIVLGVLLSNQFQGRWLKLALAGFIVLYCISNLRGVTRKGAHDTRGPERVRPPVIVPIGAVTGTIAGLLGIGGGVIMVPILQALARIPLRQAIATSSAVMCLTATVGAIIKVSTLSDHAQPVAPALLLAGTMGPLAMIGGRLGAGLTHALPVRVVRLSVTVLLGAAAIRMAMQA